jgi:hypothetical protein
LTSTVDAFGAEALGDHFRDFGIFADHDPRPLLDLRDLRAETGEGLRQLAADRAAAEDQQPARQFAQFPDGVGGEIADLLDAGNRRHEGPRAGGDDDAARRQPLAARRWRVTSTSQGETIFALPAITSTPSPV